MSRLVQIDEQFCCTWSFRDPGSSFLIALPSHRAGFLRLSTVGILGGIILGCALQGVDQHPSEVAGPGLKSCSQIDVAPGQVASVCPSRSPVPFPTFLSAPAGTNGPPSTQLLLGQWKRRGRPFPRGLQWAKPRSSFQDASPHSPLLYGLITAPSSCSLGPRLDNSSEAPHGRKCSVPCGFWISVPINLSSK